MIDPARLSSTSPSSDSIDIALRAAAEINSNSKIKENCNISRAGFFLRENEISSYLRHYMFSFG